ncbi:MAG: DUF2250 domain-containing protein [Bacillota bacterium]
MGRGPFFNSSYLSDAEILSRIEKIVEDRNRLFDVLAAANDDSDPAAMSELARRFYELDKIHHSFNRLVNLIDDLQEIEKMIGEGGAEDAESLRLLHTEYTGDCAEEAGRLYGLLLEKGYIGEEVLDGADLAILRFIEYAGPEYAWRLGINIGIGTKEARDRLQTLLEKGLLEKVQGTMLEGYHREKDWVKHMNHTYYRLSRKGRLFLRQIRRKGYEG